MSKTVFKGSIKGATVAARFNSDFSNLDSDLLLIAKYTEIGGSNLQEDQTQIQPGGSATVSLKAPKKGVLEVRVVTGHDDDSGRLQVTGDGTVKHDEPTKGSVLWVYAVSEK
jgi:hypothetical protein